MNKLCKYIAGIMIASLTMGIAGCSLPGKTKLTHKNVCDAFDKFGAQELDDIFDLTEKVGARSPQCEGGYYFTTDDGVMAQYTYEKVIFRFGNAPECDIEECTYFAETNEENDSMLMLYVITFEDEKYAKALFDDTKEEFSYDDKNASGSKNGYDYAVCTGETTQLSMRGIYLQDNVIVYFRGFAPEKEGLKAYEGLIKDIGLVSPLK